MTTIILFWKKWKKNWWGEPLSQTEAKEKVDDFKEALKNHVEGCDVVKTEPGDFILQYFTGNSGDIHSFIHIFAYGRSPYKRCLLGTQ